MIASQKLLQLLTTKKLMKTMTKAGNAPRGRFRPRAGVFAKRGA
jgi:hypothetical protein